MRCNTLFATTVLLRPFMPIHPQTIILFFVACSLLTATISSALNLPLALEGGQHNHGVDLPHDADGDEILPRSASYDSSSRTQAGTTSDEDATNTIVMVNSKHQIRSQWWDDPRVMLHIHRFLLLHRGNDVIPHRASDATAPSSRNTTEILIAPTQKKSALSDDSSPSSGGRGGTVSIMTQHDDDDGAEAAAPRDDFRDDDDDFLDCNSDRLSLQLQLFCHYYSNQQ
jgi:hypothetical protein